MIPQIEIHIFAVTPLIHNLDTNHHTYKSAIQQEKYLEEGLINLNVLTYQKLNLNMSDLIFLKNI